MEHDPHAEMVLRPLRKIKTADRPGLSPPLQFGHYRFDRPRYHPQERGKGRQQLRKSVSLPASARSATQHLAGEKSVREQNSARGGQGTAKLHPRPQLQPLPAARSPGRASPPHLPPRLSPHFLRPLGRWRVSLPPQHQPPPARRLPGARPHPTRPRAGKHVHDRHKEPLWRRLLELTPRLRLR